MRLLKTSEYEIGRAVTVSSSVGYLVVKLIESFPGLGAFLFEWRFESDTAWARVEVSPEEDVIDKVMDLASDIYQHTGRRQQPDIYRPAPFLPRSEPEPLPVVFDRHCPRDYEDEAFGVRWVGVRKKATHEIVRIVGDKHGRPTKVEVCLIDREAESAAWSAQLRVKLAEQKERDAEAARYTPWWSPEEQQGGDL